jgi:hypothetical protein
MIFFEYAIYSSVEFCSISYNHPFLPILYVHPHMRNTSIFTNRQFSIVHSLALPSNLLTHPYRTALPMQDEFQAHNGTPWRIFPSIKTATLHPPNTSTPLLQMSQVLPASRVPRRHVLLHAVCESGLLGRRDGRARVGDRALEAVLVDFL